MNPIAGSVNGPSRAVRWVSPERTSDGTGVLPVRRLVVRRLRAGRYTVSIVARDAFDNRSRTARARVTVR